MELNLTILGSGTSTGVPMVGCYCSGCISADERDKRSRASAMLQYNGKAVIIDTTPDLRMQMLREKVGKVDAVLYTHPHADHVNGIDDLRGFHFLHKEVIPCYGSAETMTVLEKGFAYIFREYDNSGYPPLLEPHTINGKFDLFGITIEPLDLAHGKTSATGFRFGSSAYLTDCSMIPDETMDKIRGLDLLIIDGLRWESHPSHFNIETVIETTRGLGIKTVVLTHLTHSVLYSEQSKLPENYFFAFDGMKFKCSA